LSSNASNHARIPILYVILGVLLVISIIPMYFYSAQVEAINRDRLKTNEMLLQNTVTRSLADDLSQHERSLYQPPDNQRRHEGHQRHPPYPQELSHSAGVAQSAAPAHATIQDHPDPMRRRCQRLEFSEAARR